MLTSDVPTPNVVLQQSTTTSPSVLSQQTSEIERQVLRKLLIDLFYASPRSTSELAIQQETREKTIQNPQETGQQVEGVNSE